MMTEQEKNLDAEATRLLRSSGFTWAGRDRRKVVVEQCAMEKRMISTPMSGLSRRKPK
jgi:hypothetical protein